MSVQQCSDDLDLDLAIDVRPRAYHVMTAYPEYREHLGDDVRLCSAYHRQSDSDRRTEISQTNSTAARRAPRHIPLELRLDRPR
jgi:hypothetical protein